MEPRHFIKEECIILDLKTDSKKEIIAEMLDVLIQYGDVFAEDRRALIDELLEREKKGSTAIGNQVAIPHCKTALIDKITVAIAFKKVGVDFEALDKKPVNIFILTLSPKKASASHIEFLAFVSNVFQNEQNRQEIQTLTSKKEVYDFILKRGGF